VPTEDEIAAEKKKTEREQAEAAKKAEREHDENEKKAAATAVELAASSDRIRETAKWLVATFGAVAGALIVGLQLSDIGDLEGSDRTWAAIAAGAALFAVVAIVVVATSVLARARVPLGELSKTGDKRFKRLRKALNRNPILYPGYESVEAMVDAVEDQLTKQIENQDRKQDQSLTEKERQTAGVELRKARVKSRELTRLSDRLLPVARAEDMRLTFGLARNLIALFAVIVVAAAILFAVVDNAPGAEETAALPQRPTAARLNLDASGQEKLATILGPECDLEKVPVEVLSTSEQEVSDVVAIPAEGCHAARLSIDADDGEFKAMESTPLPTTEEEEEEEEEIPLPTPH
jgi:hypothetical protein